MNGKSLMAKVVSGAVFPVSENGTLTLMGAGLLGFAFFYKKKVLAQSGV
jgi:LPXTG-motif cell wall-anchored protein